MKRVISLFLLLSIFMGSFSNAIYALESVTPVQKKIVVYLKPDVCVKLNDIEQIFRDAKGSIVYPIFYNGTAYLPVRAISNLMKESIEWDAASKTVFIGKTLSDPNKSFRDTSGQDPATSADSSPSMSPLLVNAYLKPDVLVMYNFMLQTFEDVNGNQVYPINYNGTTYLPIRAISQLMNEPIEWEGSVKTILIGDGEEQPQNNNDEEVETVSANAKNLKSLFEREEILFYEATAKTTNLKETVSLEKKQLIAAAVSDNYSSAQNLSNEIKTINISGYNEEEIAAYDKLTAFAESTEYYILILENIAYLAAQDADYSMLADTFLYFAMDSQSKMEDARVLIQQINQ
jgi:hypothetical protein